MSHHRVIAASLILLIAARHGLAQEAAEPRHLRDRGTGVATSMFGSYVRAGELLVYPFFEYYVDNNLEYKPSELGYAGDIDYRGRYRASEGLLFLSYGLGEDWAIEVEAAVISARLDKAPDDVSTMPARVEESGLGDVEGQIRWRFMREAGSRPEGFTYFETVFPLQKDRRLIGTSDWEWKLGFGFTRGYDFGTMSFRIGIEYDRAERKFDAGEYAIEYLRRVSPRLGLFAMIEGNQLDEVALITEVQWHFGSRVYLKAGTGVGLTPNATDFAPEIGLMIRL